MTELEGDILRRIASIEESLRKTSDTASELKTQSYTRLAILENDLRQLMDNDIPHIQTKLDQVDLRTQTIKEKMDLIGVRMERQEQRLSSLSVKNLFLSISFMVALVNGVIFLLQYLL